MNVANIHVIIISLGFADLCKVRKAIIVVGIIVTPPVFNTKNVIIASLAVSSKERNDCGIGNMSIESNYSLKVIEKISECNMNFQADYIYTLLRIKEYNPNYNTVLLNNISNVDKRLKVIELFTKAENEDACKKMLETIQENVEKLRNNPDRIINMLEECTTLKSDEDYVNITAITEIEDLEEILDNMDDGVEIDESVKVKVKKKKK